jgi:predicted TIM-barrel fold metal-dependent hydrolase
MGYPATPGGRSTHTEVLISADAHVGEPEALRQRMPEPLRGRFPIMVYTEYGDLETRVEGESIAPRAVEIDERAREKEFRADPSLGTDLEVRYRDMAREGVDGQVVFPNIGLEVNSGDEPPEFHQAWARAHNDFVHEVFAPDRKRFKLAAMLAVEDVSAAVGEAERCVKRGFETLFVPCTMPWQPYRLPVYEPLWSFAEEAGVPINFHVFSGNLSPLGGDFASLGQVSPERQERARRLYQAESRDEHLSTTCLGIASGMSPILELTGAGVLERHPRLRFVVTEAESGWLAWVLQIMDQMQERRGLYLRALPLRASDYFRRQGAITISDDPVALHNVAFTGVDCLLWGNDYPHDEGTWPDSRPRIDAIRAALGPADARKVLCENAARLYGFDLEYLARHKAQLAQSP